MEPGPALLAIEAEMLATPHNVTPEPSPPPAPTTTLAEPVDVRYAASGTGSTAYTGFGHGDIDVVIMNPAMLTIDGLTEEPHVLSALRTLAVDARVTCFDRRGIGLSDPLSADGDHDRRLGRRSRCGARRGGGRAVPRSWPTSTPGSWPSSSPPGIRTGSVR